LNVTQHFDADLDRFRLSAYTGNQPPRRLSPDALRRRRRLAVIGTTFA
jgi:hypothetical protein